MLPVLHANRAKENDRKIDRDYEEEEMTWPMKFVYLVDIVRGKKNDEIKNLICDIIMRLHKSMYLQRKKNSRHFDSRNKK